MGEAGQVSDLMQALYKHDQALADELRVGRELDVMEAAALGETEVLARLLDEDPARVSEWSADGFTPLHYAVFFGTPEAAQLLIDRGADLEIPARNTQFALHARPLHSAAAARAYEACRVLLAAGADPNAEQHGGYTPLKQAVQAGDEKLVALLREYGATR